ncbi:MAG: hopanoid biosynthesis associated radical SAM protein HpnH [Candidatus Omnitrophica bacterium CG11_big_fil_rev_8_21_14_0_20_64_10]|nr:MAG: hopanoid biosynthesis associated radical SAM protein HpnH [Candidatus Omnitrophica bacterium CG11_big_fil_rev_8_21_14_0_20_64_10]
MAIAWRQGLSVGSHIFRQKLKRNDKYALVLMLEPLFRCNLECAGCGKIQYPEDILKKRLSPDECEKAALECGAPVVSIAGGEPLIHPEMPEIVRRLVKHRRFVYLCTNALLLERRMKDYTPSPYFRFSIHLDGLEETHDKSVCRKGVFKQAVEGIKLAKKAGFQVSTNTTIFLGSDPTEFRRMFDFLTDLGVDGMMISPGYAYEKAPDQQHFLKREETKALFRKILDNADPRWRFNHSSFFLEFLRGERDYRCTAWGNPTRNVFGWQKPCYLMSDGYVNSYRELIEETDWDRYGTGKDPRCADCMVHCGYEPTAVSDATGSFRNMLREMGWGREEEKPAVSSDAELVRVR